MPKRNVATNYTFEQQRQEINLIAADLWDGVLGGASTDFSTVVGWGNHGDEGYLKKDGSVATTAAFTFGNKIIGPSTFTIEPTNVNGTVVIAGNLQVDGTQTAVNSTTMDVTDLNITVAKGAANAAAADTAGITVDGANATLQYEDGSPGTWESSLGFRLDGKNGSAGLSLDLAGSADYLIRESTTDDIVQFGGTGAANFFAHNLSSGNFGIANANPSYKLDVTGTLRATGSALIEGSHSIGDNYSGGGASPELYVRGNGGRAVKIHNPDVGTSCIQLTNATTGEGEDKGFFVQQLSSGDAMFTHIPADKDIIFRTSDGGTIGERLRITSDGEIRIDGPTSATHGIRFTPNGWNGYDNRIGICGSSGADSWWSSNWNPTDGSRDSANYATNYIRHNVSTGYLSFGAGGVDESATERLRITSGGALGTNSTVRSATGGLDLCAQGAVNLGTLTLGGSGGQNGTNRNANTENQFRIMSPTYADPSNMFTVMYGASGSSQHEINYGGGTGWAYAANLHRFFTAGDQTTGTGTERFRIDSNGYVTITDTPTLLIKNSSNAGNGVGGITIGKDYAGTDGCIQINSINSGSDTDHLGIEFKVHPSGSGSAQPDRKMVLDHTGKLIIGEIESTIYGQTPDSGQGAQLTLVGNADGGNPGAINLFGYGNTSNEAHGRINFQQQTTGYNGQTTARIEAINRSGGEDASDLVFYTEKTGDDLKKNLELTHKGCALFHKNTTGEGTATNLSFDSLYLGIGESEGGVNVYRTIGFGYRSNTTSEYPASMGCQITDWNQNTKAELVFATRDTTGQADVATERLRIYANGNMKLHNGQFTASRSGASNLTAIRCENGTWDSNAHCRVQIATAANQGGDPYIHFDAGGSNMIIGNKYEGTTNNYIVMGPGDSPEGGIVNGGGVRVRGNGRVMMPLVYSTNGSSMNDVQIESDGTLCAGNTSIRAAKKNILSQTDVSWLYDLNPVTFNYRKKTVGDDNKNTYLEEIEEETSYGLIAEEVEAVKKDFCFYDNDDKLAGVYYKQLITPLLKALQDQKKEIDDLKAQVATLS